MRTDRKHLTLAVNHPPNKEGTKTPNRRIRTYLVNVILPRVPGERHYTCRSFVVRATGEHEAAALVHGSGYVTPLSEHIVIEVGEDHCEPVVELDITPKQANYLRERVKTIFMWPLNRLPRGDD